MRKPPPGGFFISGAARMPTIVPALVGALVEYGVATGLEYGTLAGAIAGALAAAGTSRLLASHQHSTQGENVRRGALIDTTESYAPIPVIYGSRRVGGIRFVTEVSDSPTQLATSILGTIPSQAPFTQANPALYDPTLGPFLADIAVTDRTGAPFAKVGGAPGPRQYSVDASALYTFNAGDGGTDIAFFFYYRPTGSLNAHLHLALLWGEGEVGGIDALYLDE
jgi:hypothetical protein